jgi:hypothetical protein
MFSKGSTINNLLPTSFSFFLVATTVPTTLAMIMLSPSAKSLGNSITYEELKIKFLWISFLILST